MPKLADHHWQPHKEINYSYLLEPQPSSIAGGTMLRENKPLYSGSWSKPSPLFLLSQAEANEKKLQVKFG